MKLLTEYIFYNAWQETRLNLTAGDCFTVTQALGKLSCGDEVTYVGFEDVDNHYGIFVFKNQKNQALEIGGDFSTLSDQFISEFNTALQKIYVTSM